MRAVCLDGFPIYPASDSRWAAFADVCDFEVYDRTEPSEVAARAAETEVVLTNKVPLTEQTIAALPHLKYIGVLATGYNIVDVEAARSRGIVVTNIPSYSTMSVAQHVFTLLLGIVGRVEHYTALNKAGRWSTNPDFTYLQAEWAELAGKTFGIVGFGNIGRAVGRIAEAFGMTVAVYTSKSADMLPAGYVKMELDELFANSDVLSLHCPLTPETHNLVDARRLALMKPSAIIINTSRGPVIDEEALANALNSHRIYAAGLDVMCQEPPTRDNVLLQAENCFTTPHLAWASAEARHRLFNIALDNLKAFADGTPVNRVD